MLGNFGEQRYWRGVKGQALRLVGAAKMPLEITLLQQLLQRGFDENENRMHPISATRSQTRRGSVKPRAMSFPGNTVRRGTVPLWQILTCLLLAGLFLYNPFLAVGRWSGKTAVCHPASYRGTIASSELEQFTPPNRGVAALLPDADAAQVLIRYLDLNNSTPPYYVEQEDLATPQTGFSSSLWFRPPPTV